MLLLMMIDAPEDRSKFCILYETYRHLLHTVAMDVLHDCHLAEDAVQEAFLRIAKNMEKIGETDSRQTRRYLISTARNAAIDIYRKRNRQMQREVNAWDAETEMPVTYLETDVDNAVLDILKNLPAKYRDVFLLKYSADLENSQIAEICGIREGTVRQRIARGKALIQDALEKLERGEPI